MRYLIFAAVLAANSAYAQEKEITFYTLKYYPYGYEDTDGKIQGFSVDLYQALMNQIGGEKPAVKFLPTARVKHVFTTGKNILLYPWTYSKARSEFSRWVFHAHDATGQYFHRVGESVPEPLMKLKLKDNTHSIGVVRGSIFEKIIRSGNIQDKYLSFANNSNQNIQKLINRRVDFVFSTSSVYLAEVNKPGSEHLKDTITYSDVVTRSFINVAGSQSFEPQLLEKIVTGFNQLESNGTLKKIVDKYYFFPKESVEQSQLFDSDKLKN